LRRRNPVAEQRHASRLKAFDEQGRVDSSIRGAMRVLKVHSVSKDGDLVVQSFAEAWRLLTRSCHLNATSRQQQEKCRDAIRTAGFVSHYRGAALVDLYASGWLLSGPGLQTYLMNFSRHHRAGDRGSTNTKVGNGAALDVFLPFIHAGSPAVDEFHSALTQTTRAKAQTALTQIAGFDGFSAEHIISTFAVIDKERGMLPWTRTAGKRGRECVDVGNNTKKLLDEFFPDCSADIAIHTVTKLINERLPQAIVVDGQPCGSKRLSVDVHAVQQMLCKVYQVLQFLFSCSVGDHGRDVDKVATLLHSLQSQAPIVEGCRG